MQLPADKLSENAISNIKLWLDSPKYQEYRSGLKALIVSNEWQKLEDSFFKNIEFGTGGMRGTTGIGSNRINRVTISQAAQAVCDYLSSLDKNASEKGIVIAFDTRLTSIELSRVTAEVVAANNFKTYIFDSFRSTPELSFAVRYLKCAAGIVISASHNPPTDNGFKVYWNDGGQIVPPHDKGIMDAVARAENINQIEFDSAVDEGRIISVGNEIDEAYLIATTAQAEGTNRDINIVYSPLHGTGQTNVLPTLRKAGFQNISLVEKQMVPDGNFSTIKNGKPNPEEISANDMAVEQMMQEKADIAITNDPDADRLGVIVRKNQEKIYLNGNQTAVLATDFALKELQSKGVVMSGYYIVKTIVTTDMLNALAENYGVKIYDNLLIGFKYIGDLIGKIERTTDEKFVIGCEESYGLLKGDYVRDKDAATGALPLLEYAAELKQQGKTLYDRLMELFSKYGVYVEKLENMTYPGADGFARMQRIMASLRQNPPTEIAGEQITAVLDYRSLNRTDLKNGGKTRIDCMDGDVFVLEFGDKRNRFSIRPSGTEPKIKVYAQWYELADKENSTENQYASISSKLDEMIKELNSYLSSL